MVKIGLSIVAQAEKFGIEVHPFRSGGGHGMHLWSFWEGPQNAKHVRHLLRAILASLGLKDGAGGVARGEVEVFPKQDSVKQGSFGNLIAVPGARASVALCRASLEPIEWDVIDVPAESSRMSRNVPEVHDEEHSTGAVKLPGDVAEAASAMSRISASDYDVWLRVGLAMKATFGEDGYEPFATWSATAPEKFDGEPLLRKFWDGLKPNGDVGLGTIFFLGKRAGWNGPSNPMVRGMNSRFGILTFGNSTLIIPKNGDRRPEDDFMGLAKRTFLDRLAPETFLIDTGPGGATRRIPKAGAWLKDENACHYHRLDFDPSKPPGDNGLTWNMWTGFGVQPHPGDWSLLRAHITDNIARGDSDKATWFVNWMALGVQRPAEPIGTAVVMIGNPGTGKGVAAHAYGKLWGSHYIPVTHAEHVSGRFTGHFAGRRLIFVDEGTFGGNRAAAGNLKTRITEPWLVLERKGVDAIRMRNRMIFMIASNEASVVPADKGDRRWMVFDVGDDRREDHEYFSAIQAQLDHGGYEAMLYDLLRMDLKIGPNPRRIIRTAALFEQMLLALGPEIRFIHHLLDGGRLPQNIVAGADSTTIKALVMDMRSQHFDAGYVNDIRLGRLIRQVIPDIRTAISGVFIATDKSGGTFQERSTRYTFPALPKARVAFEKHISMPVPWSEVSEWQSDPEEDGGESRMGLGDVF